MLTVPTSDEAATRSGVPAFVANAAGVGQTTKPGTLFGSANTTRASARCQATAPVLGSSAITHSRERW